MGRTNQQCMGTRVLIYTEVRKAQKQRRPSQPSWPCTRPTCRAMDRRHGCFLGQQKTPNSGSQASPSPAAPPQPLSNTGRAVQLQFPDFCLQPTGREHLQSITMCFGLYAKTSFYHHIFCCGDFPVCAPLLHARQGLHHQLAMCCRAGSLEPCSE